MVVLPTCTFNNSRRIRPLAAVAILGTALACADDGRGSGTEGGSLATLTNNSQGTGPMGTETSMTTVGGSDSDSMGGVKFDIGEPPNGTGLNCDEENGGEAMDLSYIWIANTDVGTVSKINTRTGVIEGRYRTANGSESPSRTTVNQFGDTLVANRGGNASVTVISSFQERCKDSNNDGWITTSIGTDDVKDWGSDECVLWHLTVPATYEYGPRAVAWEGGTIDPVTCENSVPDPRVWIAYDTDTTYEVWRLNGKNGQILDQVSIPSSEGRPYGGAVNREGDFWFVARGSKLVHVDAETLAPTQYTPPSVPYGMSIDANGDPWIAVYSVGAGDQVYRFDVETQQFVSSGGGIGYHRGMMLDYYNRAWVVGNKGCRLALVDAANDTLIEDNIPLPGCNNPVGVSIDIDDYVWVVDQGASLAHKIDPDTLQVVLTVENLYKPYTYSDMTGSLLRLVANPPA